MRINRIDKAQRVLLDLRLLPEPSKRQGLRAKRQESKAIEALTEAFNLSLECDLKGV